MRFYRRTFLNKPRHQSSAHVIAKVQIDRQAVNASLRIADCTRSVDLDFDVWPGCQKGDVANVRFKAALLRRTVNEFCDALEAALEEKGY